MQLKTLAIAAGLAGISLAQRPANVSICDYYTTALLKNNTAANQYTVLTLVVNTAVIGNYSTINVGIKVPGILAPGTFNGTAVNLLPYFDGGLVSTSNFSNPSQAIAVNFLDGGGAAPLMMNMPANSNTSAQYTLLTHLYQYFGVLLGCSGVGTADFPSYKGSGSQYNVHRFMDLSAAEVGYFITQVGLSAASFGVATADVTAVGNALAGIFDVRCAPPTTVVPSQGAQLQSICTADDCPLSPNATCAAYPAAVVPLVANSTLAMGLGMNGTASSSASSAAGSGTATAAGGAGSSGSATSSGAAKSSGAAASGTSIAGSGSGSGSSGPGSATTTGVATYTGAAEVLKAQVGALIGGAAALAALVL